MPALPRAILVFRSAALGDFIIGCPALKRLRDLYPTSKLVLLTTQSATKEQRDKVARYAGDTGRVPWVELARPHLLDDVIVLDNLGSRASIARVREELRAYPFDLVVLLLEPGSPWQGRMKKLVLMWVLLGPLIRIVGWRGPGWLLSQKARVHARGALRHHVTGAMQFLREL